MLVDFGRRTVFRRRVNLNRGNAVLIDSVRRGRARRVELGVVLTERGRAVWVPNPDADPDLFAAFRRMAGGGPATPVSWALDRPAAARLPRRVGGWRHRGSPGDDEQSGADRLRAPRRHALSCTPHRPSGP